MADLLKLRKFVSPEIIFGEGSRHLTGKYARQFGGRKVLIVTDPGVIKAGWLVDIQKSLESVGLPFTVFSNVSPNPRSYEAEAGAEIFRDQGCNVIVSVGGGSPMDCAKAIGIIVTNKKSILEFEGVDRIGIPVPPMIFIPTTAGTSADVSQFCIISDRQELVKIAIVSKAIVPDVSLIDPDTTTTMDSYLTACTGVDALVHAIEAYVSTGSGPLTDNYAEDAIQLVYQNLPLLLKDPANSQLREKIMLASMKAGLAFSNAILGAVHAMAHSLGGYLDLAHGECNALLLEHVINFNFDSCPEKFTKIAQLMDIDVRGLTKKQVKNRLITTVLQLKREVGITEQLERKGVKLTDIPNLSSKAIKDACMITNPRKANLDDVGTIYREAL